MEQIEVEGKQIDVTSNEGYIENTIVRIVQVKGKTVIVKRLRRTNICYLLILVHYNDIFIFLSRLCIF